MKVIAINGSPNPNGNTAQALQAVCAVLQQQGIETELLQLGGKPYYGCLDCGGCAREKNGRCTNDRDGMNRFIEAMVEADGVLIGSPTYFSNCTAEVKALIDRAGMATRRGGNLMRRKVGAAVVPVRRSGANVTFSAINYFFQINEMVVPSSCYWNMTVRPFAEDAEGQQIMQTLGENFAWVLQQLQK